VKGLSFFAIDVARLLVLPEGPCYGRDGHTDLSSSASSSDVLRHAVFEARRQLLQVGEGSRGKGGCWDDRRGGGSNGGTSGTGSGRPVASRLSSITMRHNVGGYSGFSSSSTSASVSASLSEDADNGNGNGTGSKIGVDNGDRNAGGGGAGRGTAREGGGAVFRLARRLMAWRDTIYRYTLPHLPPVGSAASPLRDSLVGMFPLSLDLPLDASAGVGLDAGLRRDQWALWAGGGARGASAGVSGETATATAMDTASGAGGGGMEGSAAVVVVSPSAPSGWTEVALVTADCGLVWDVFLAKGCRVKRGRLTYQQQ
jgi:hypothetical protein